MAEKFLVVDRLKFSYEGLVNFAELYNVIQAYFFEKGWDWNEKMNQEMVTPNGKQVRLHLNPWKSTSDYYKLRIDIHLQGIDLKEVEVEQDGHTLRLQHGVIRIVMDGFLVADRKNQWNSKPFLWFLIVMREKYLFKQHFEKMETWIKSDVDEIYNKIKNYLNVFKYTYHT